MIARRLLGLEGAISMGIAGPLHDDRSRRFHNDPDNRDPVLGIEYQREAYEKTVPGYDKGVTVPAVIEIASGKVVTNAYEELEFDVHHEVDRGLARVCIPTAHYGVRTPWPIRRRPATSCTPPSAERRRMTDQAGSWPRPAASRTAWAVRGM
ncbi:hypothetical protein [Pseudonocardia asaccharolytica]|uniref:hypothetical protein n=1 Tax=Pseudonocardia asaccharolytica TaxID=54010 RepID=UPI001FDF3F18